MSEAGTKTCSACGASKPLDDFAPHSSGRFGRRSKCRACYRAARRIAEAEYRRTHAQRLREAERERAARLRASRPLWAERRNAEAIGYARDAQAESLPRATNYGKEWTGPELEIAARDDLSARDAAQMLGRTYAAVVNQRRKLRAGDPKKSTLAGLRRPGSAA